MASKTRAEAQIAVERSGQDYRVRVAGEVWDLDDGSFDGTVDAACDDEGGHVVGDPLALSLDESLRAVEALHEAAQHPEVDYGSGCRNPFCVLQTGHAARCSAFFFGRKAVA